MGPLVDLGFICIQNLLILEISGQDGNVLVVLTTIFGRDSTWICQIFDGNEERVCKFRTFSD